MTAATEHELLIDARAGDRAARDAIVARYMPLARYVARRHAHGVDLEDLVQDLAVEVLDMISRWDPAIGSDLRGLAPWRLHARAQSIRRRRALAQSTAARWRACADVIVMPSSSDPLARSMLRDALAALPPRTRACVLRVVALDASAADVAAQLHIHPASVRRIVREGLRALVIAMGAA